MFRFQALGNPLVMPNDLDGMLRAFHVRDQLVRQEAEYGWLSVKAGPYRPGNTLPARISSGNLGGKPSWRIGESYFLEAAPGILVSSTSRTGTARLATPPVPASSHLPAPAGAFLTLQISPEFLRTPMWKEALGPNNHPKDGKPAFDFARVGTIQFIARLKPTAIAVEFRLAVTDDAMLVDFRKHLDDQALAKNPFPGPEWAKNVEPKLEGRNYILRFDVEDQTIDRLIPSPEQVQGWLQITEVLRGAFQKR